MLLTLTPLPLRRLYVPKISCSTTATRSRSHTPGGGTAACTAADVVSAARRTCALAHRLPALRTLALLPPLLVLLPCHLVPRACSTSYFHHSCATTTFASHTVCIGKIALAGLAGRAALSTLAARAQLGKRSSACSRD